MRRRRQRPAGKSRGEGRGGPWNVDVARAGLYRIELRRWPEESGLSLSEAAPAFHGAYGDLEPGVELAIASGVLAHDGEEREKPATPEADSVAFELRLPAGQTKLHGWFRDEAGRDICGAYYAYFTRVAE